MTLSFARDPVRLFHAVAAAEAEKEEARETLLGSSDDNMACRWSAMFLWLSQDGCVVVVGENDDGGNGR